VEVPDGIKLTLPQRFRGRSLHRRAAVSGACKRRRGSGTFTSEHRDGDGMVTPGTNPGGIDIGLGRAQGRGGGSIRADAASL
jgi:hypothetical protein